MARGQERGLREGRYAIGIGCDPRGAGSTWSLVVLLVVVLANKRWNGPRRCNAAKGGNLAYGTAQCAASNRPLPGAETALILYHRYFCGKPARRATKAGFFPPFYR